MPQKIISLSAKEDLNIYMSPQRQQLLRVMRIHGKPMTAKALADKLSISASSATHHISKLMQLGVIEEDHTEVIKGITARYFSLANVMVNIGQQIDDGFTDERTAIVQNMLLSTLKGMNDGLEQAKRSGIPSEHLKDYGDCISGILHLKPEDACALLKIIREYLDEHEHYEQGTQPWEFALILYNSGYAI